MTANLVNEEAWDDGKMRRGSRDAFVALALGVVIAVALLAAARGTGMAQDPPRLLLISLFAGIGYLFALGRYQKSWRFSTVSLSPDGFTAPRRSFLAAIRGQPGKTIRFQEVVRAGILLGPAGDKSHARTLGIRTEGGLVFKVRERDYPEGFERLASALKPLLEKTHRTGESASSP
jgi:hypothetical protein